MTSLHIQKRLAGSVSGTGGGEDELNAVKIIQIHGCLAGKPVYVQM